MTVGTDSYVSVSEADEYISKRYTSANADRLRWAAFSDQDKEILLLNACTELEALPFRGRKALIAQPLAFPRMPYQWGHDLNYVPEAIKQAQIELALYLSNENKQSELSQRQSLQAQGVQSFSIGDLSESYASGGSMKAAPLLCAKSARLLASYLNGGFGVC
jgi:hypothetical protein